MDPDVARESDSARRSRSGHTMDSPQNSAEAGLRAIGSDSIEPIASSPELDALLLEGLDSGPAFPVDDAWWRRKRAELKERLKQSRNV